MGDEYANEIVVLGKGEGRKMKRAQVYRYDGRLRRVATVTDKSLSSDSALRTRGTQELARPDEGPADPRHPGHRPPQRPVRVLVPRRRHPRPGPRPVGGRRRRVAPHRQ
ncbi:hypothetical protein R2F25_38245 [Streptomyces sp. UP1A-1]|nr:hypothetical protein [Streptomyces sp. UP1A-1]